MSLKVWLPLDGSLENKGEETVDITTNGTIDYSVGKIGANAVDTTNGNIVIPLDFIDEEMSVCFWLYDDDTIHANGVFALGYTLEDVDINNSNRLAVTDNFLNDERAYNWYSLKNSISLVERTTTMFYLRKKEWCHIAITIDGQRVNVYKNGILASEHTQLNSLAKIFEKDKVIKLGSRYSNGDRFNGFFDDLHIYDHALSAKEVKEISKALITHYKLDNSSPDGVEKDVSGYDHNGIKNGSLTYTSDSARYVASTQFNYSTISNIQIPYIFTDNQQVNEFSLSCWINSEKSTEYHNFITLNGNRFIRCRITPGRNLQMILYINNSTKVVTADLKGMLSENAWNLINVIFKNGVFNVYLNSVLMSKFDYSAESTYMLYTHTHNNYIGSFDGSSENFNGSISDVRIYSTALSEDEIKELYETSAIIDDKGNLYAYDFIEDTSIKIGKNGVINASTFEENGNGDCKVYADGKISANKFIAY